jgi:hypothetical protein
MTCGDKGLYACSDTGETPDHYRSSDGLHVWRSAQEAVDWCYAQSIPAGSGGAGAKGGASGGSWGSGGSSTGGNRGTGGSVSAGTGGRPGAGGSTGIARLPGDLLNQAGNRVVAAHSTVRVLVTGYTGPLYQLCADTAVAGPNSCKGTARDIGSVEGYADIAAHEDLCPEDSYCTITKIYDQSGLGNDLEPAPKGGAKSTPDNPAKARWLPVVIQGHSAYGILIKPGIGYRTGCATCTIAQGNGMAKGDEPETIYMVTSQRDLVDNCCFEYGNAETTCNADGNGAAEALYFGAGVVWGTGSGGKPGPWVMADLEYGLYAGWENQQDKNISTNRPLKYDFVTAVVLGDTAEKNGGKGRFALYGGDATAGALQTMYDGIRPEKPGFVPRQKQGSIVLGSAGDNSSGGAGRFYEGAVAIGPVPSQEVLDALQAAIVGASYGK